LCSKFFFTKGKKFKNSCGSNSLLISDLLACPILLLRTGMIQIIQRNETSMLHTINSICCENRRKVGVLNASITVEATIEISYTVYIVETHSQVYCIGCGATIVRNAPCCGCQLMYIPSLYIRSPWCVGLMSDDQIMHELRCL
jgi:hypothetical protein